MAYGKPGGRVNRRRHVAKRASNVRKSMGMGGGRRGTTAAKKRRQRGGMTR